MISWKELYDVVSHVGPLYVAMILAYGSVKWRKFFSPNESSGISRYVGMFALPFLTVRFISNSNPYAINPRFIAADVLQKIVVLALLFLWRKLSSRGSLEWCITLFSLSSFPNSLVVGIPLLGGMFRDETLIQSLMVQISIMQFNVWLPVLLFMLEYRRAILAISPEQQSETEAVSETMTEMCASIEECSNKNSNETLDEEIELRVDVTLPSESPEITECDVQGVCSTNPADSHVQLRGNVQGHSESISISKVEDQRKSVASVKQILIVVYKRVIRNPNFYCSLLALSWSFISSRYHVKMPAIVENSIKIIADTGLGMAMFNLGLFAASQPRIIAGGVASASLATAIRFVAGPMITAATSTAVGLRGKILRIAILQAALPEGVISFVFAQEYNVNPDIINTAVSFGMLLSLPIAVSYFVLLDFIT